MSDRLSFCCPSCRAPLSASRRFAGRSCACPRCGHAVKVPTPRPEPRPILPLIDPQRRLMLNHLRTQMRVSGPVAR